VIVGAGAISACGSDDEDGGGGKSSEPIRVGVIADLTGPIAFVGRADAQVAKMVASDINKDGGLLGRKVKLTIVDSASDPGKAATVAQQLVTKDHVDVVIGGVLSNIRTAIEGVVAERGNTLYVQPNASEGGECGRNVFVTGASPTQLVDPLVQHFTEQGAKTWYLVGSDYDAPRGFEPYLKKAIEAAGGKVVGSEFLPLTATNVAPTVNRILTAKPDVVEAIVIPPAITPFFQQLTDAGYVRNGGKLAGPLYDDGTLTSVPAAQLEGLVSSLDYYQSLDDPFDRAFLERYNREFSAHAKAPYAATGGVQAMHRAMLLWAAAVRNAGSTDTDAMREAMDHASIDEGPGGPASVVPGSHHVKINMYLGQAEGGRFVVKDKVEQVDPRECGA
jgi:branched-chain amino acid transport system substrate-binding protein